jgi:hypothetical protein
MPEIEKKEVGNFGAATIARIGPAAVDGIDTISIEMKFEEALKIHLALGEAIAQLNSYNCATRLGKNSAVKIIVHGSKKRIRVLETQLN